MVIMPQQPVCSPLTMKFMPQYLRELDYSTHMVGKWHLGFCKWACTPTERGFESFFGYYNAEEGHYNHTFQSGYDYRNGREVYKEKTPVYSTYTFTQKAQKIIEMHEFDKKPLFLYLAFQNVHQPLEVPKKYEDLYPDVQDKNRRIYQGMVSIMDEAIMNVTDTLKREGVYDNTLIVFTTDNGGNTDYLGNNLPLRGGKYSLYEGGTRGVAFLRGPGVPQSDKRYDGMIHAVDWLPTFVDAAGGDTCNIGDGVSQWNSIKKLAVPSARREIVYNLDDLPQPSQGVAAIRDDRFKLIRGYPGMYSDWYQPVTPTVSGRSDICRMGPMQYYAQTYPNQLFDLKEDPTERVNLADIRPDIVLRLSRRLDDHMATMVPAHFPMKPGNGSDPADNDGNWSPGWC